MHKYIVVYKYMFSKCAKIQVTVIEANNPQEAANIFHVEHKNRTIIKIFLYEETP